MSRNNLIFVAFVAGTFLALVLIKTMQKHWGYATLAPIVVYEVLPHPYFTGVTEGAEGFAKSSGTGVRIAMGQESTQANLNTTVESLFNVGYRAFAIYPVDPAGCKGLFARLKSAGRLAVAYGAQPAPGTDVPFTLATDTQAAATLATEKLIQFMGRQGNILDVLESMTDANTPVRRHAIEAVIAQYPNVHLIQTIGDIGSEQKGREKIESTLVARGGEINGVICTGYNTTVAAAVLLAQRNSQPNAVRIHFVGLDTDPRVLAEIKKGAIDATLAQNPRGQGYLSCLLLDLLLKGWTPRQPYQFIDAGSLVVTKDNLGSFQAGLDALTSQIAKSLKTRYLAPPKGS